MSEIRQGDRLLLHYQAVTDGQVIGASDGVPLEITAGGQDVIPGLSAAVLGMKVGERKRLRLTPGQGFGDTATAVERVIPRSRIPDGAQIGDALRLSLASISVQLWIRDIQGDDFHVSTQHPMAGKTIEIEFAVGLITRA